MSAVQRSILEVLLFLLLRGAKVLHAIRNHHFDATGGADPTCRSLLDLRPVKSRDPLFMPQGLNRVDHAGAPRGHQSRARGYHRQSDCRHRHRAQVGGYDAEEL